MPGRGRGKAWHELCPSIPLGAHFFPDQASRASNNTPHICMPAGEGTAVSTSYDFRVGQRKTDMGIKNADSSPGSLISQPPGCEPYTAGEVFALGSSTDTQARLRLFAAVHRTGSQTVSRPLCSHHHCPRPSTYPASGVVEGGGWHVVLVPCAWVSCPA